MNKGLKQEELFHLDTAHLQKRNTDLMNKGLKPFTIEGGEIEVIFQKKH